MEDNNSRMKSRLLDALDSSRSPMPSASSSFTNPAEAGPSTLANALAEARLTQAKALMDVETSDDEDSMFLLDATPVKLGKKMADSGGFRLNYDNETPVRAIDIGGPDQQERLATFVTQSINNFSHGFSVKSARKKLELKDEDDILPGMNVRLLPHQTIGVAWMLEKEHSADKGGILADDMGLGKTIQMIATMAMNLPKIDDKETAKTTLIVVPAALLQQWKEEIETKSNGILTVHIHHQKGKLKRRSEVRSFDVVLTTYQTLMSDFSIPKDLPAEDEPRWLLDYGGALARVKFYRAIVDEAHFIRNRSTRSSVSLAYVQAKYRWMLTGTPVTNTLADIYGLLRFGRFRPWNDWNEFNKYVAQVQYEDPPTAGQRARTILAPILLRRTKDSMLEGKPILDLPPKDIEIVRLEFSAEERDLYDSFEKKSKIRLNKFIKERTLLKNYSAIIVMILRLRQLCCHPYLILSRASEYDDPTVLVSGDAEKDQARAVKQKGRPWVDEVKRRFLLRARAQEILDFEDEGITTDANCPVCQEVFAGNNGRVLDCGHEICFDCLLNLRNSAIEHDGIFGQGSEKENLETEKRFEEANAKGHRPCPTCKKMLDVTETRVFKSAAFEPTDEELTRHAAESRRQKKKKAVEYGSSEDEGAAPEKTFEERALDSSDDELPDLSELRRPAKRQKTSVENDSDAEDDNIVDLTGDDMSQPSGSKPAGKSSKNKRKSPPSGRSTGGRWNAEKDGISEAVIATWSRGDDDLEPSTKMLQLIEYIKEWEYLGDKTICYSQWTSMLDLVGTLFSRHGISSVRFDGKMDQSSRDQTLTTFKQHDGPKVILVSTRCGGVGLNLVSANRIVNLDLSWNYAAESQAYDRAHRIGQEKPVYVKRLVVANTIEERLLKLQDVKLGLAEAALGEGTGKKLTKMSMKDIKFLFGMDRVANNKNKNGQNGRRSQPPNVSGNDE